MELPTKFNFRSIGYTIGLSVLCAGNSFALPPIPTLPGLPTPTPTPISVPAPAAAAPAKPVTAAAPPPVAAAPAPVAAATPAPVAPVAVVPAAAPPKPAGPPQMVVRRVIMKDAASAELMLAKLQGLQAAGLFRGPAPTDPKAPPAILISFQSAGSYILVVGDRALVDSAMEPVRLMSCLNERPHAHLMLNARVVQLTGPADANVIQMTETVRALVDAQRAEVVGAFADLQSFLLDRLNKRTGKDLAVYKELRAILPTLGDSSRPLTVPEILLLMMVDRSLPALPSDAASQKARAAETALTTLPQHLGSLMLQANRDDTAIMEEIAPDLNSWKQAVSVSRDWCTYYVKELEKPNGVGITGFRAALESTKCPIPTWIALRMKRSLELTQRLYPDMVTKQTRESLHELERRFTKGLDQVNVIIADLAKAEAAEKAAALAKTNPAPVKPDKKAEAAAKKGPKEVTPDVDHQLLALQTAANDLVSAPLALFNTVMAATDGSAPTAEQLVLMIHSYATERAKLSAYMDAPDQAGASNINYSKIETLEASLNLWLRRASEAMSSALEQQFYSGYVEQLRLLATKALGKNSNRDILAGSHIEEVPDIERDLLLSDSGVNVFVSNSISLQFAQDVMNSVSARVQGKLPNNLSIQDRIAAASSAAASMAGLQKQYGFQGEDIVQSLLAGGQAVPVSSGIDLSAKPSVGFDGSTVNLTLTVNETLAPDTDKVVDRVTNHSINGATISALSYEPMVVSTLASNLTYYEAVGGFPVLRQIPGLKNLLNDVPFAPFKLGKRQKGVYQSSVIILEPVVIPTIEDLVRYQSGWLDSDGKATSN